MQRLGAAARRILSGIHLDLSGCVSGVSHSPALAAGAGAQFHRTTLTLAAAACGNGAAPPPPAQPLPPSERLRMRSFGLSPLSGDVPSSLSMGEDVYGAQMLLPDSVLIVHVFVIRSTRGPPPVVLPH